MCFFAYCRCAGDWCAGCRQGCIPGYPMDFLLILIMISLVFIPQARAGEADIGPFECINKSKGHGSAGP